MAKVGAILLITQTAEAHGVHETVTETRRLVLCTVKSVRQSEYYEAYNSGFKPEYVFTLTLASDYHGEPLLEFEGKVYNVIRTYETEEGGIEITAERSDVRVESGSNAD